MDGATAPLSRVGRAVASDGSARTALVLYHRDGAKVVPLPDEGGLVVGRALPADVVIRDASLSRQHARVERDGVRVWVTDLGSTNGTRVNGSPAERVEVQPGDEIQLGAVVAGVHVLGPATAPALENYDGFRRRLDEELARARTFGRPLSVAMIRALGRPRNLVGYWLPSLRSALRPVDHAGAYGPATILLALPEMDRGVAMDAVRQLLATHADSRLVCGLAVFPADATSSEELIDVARTAARQATPTDPVQAIPVDEPGGAGDVVVADEGMRALFRMVDRAARSTVPVLIQGETGAGKEVVARAIHERSSRCEGPMRTVNCGAMPSSLLESQLFGHEKGAFTGADQRRAGLFEQADGGSVLLDEVGELSAGAQAALLRVLETKRVTRVGGTRELTVDVRVVAATNRDLEAMCDAGDFRRDLLYRINAVVLEVPPLRERTAEIEPLAELFLRQAVASNGSGPGALAPEVVERLRAYRWPGNIRELRNVIERAVALAQGKTVTLDDLPPRIRSAAAVHPARGPEGMADEDEDLPFKERVRRYETQIILDALDRTGGNQAQAARLLEMPIRTLTHKLRAYGIKKKFAK